MPRLTLVVAATTTHGIGKSGGLPWRLPKEISYFARVTTSAPEGNQNSAIMGRNTWESIPRKFRPLPKRANVVLTHNAGYQCADDGRVIIRADLHSAVEHLSTCPVPIHRHFVIGGASLYSEAFALSATDGSYVDRVLLTRVLAPAFEDCDTFVSELAQMTEDAAGSWVRKSHLDLCSWVGFDVPEGPQEEKGVRYEFQMWEKQL
ncbi:dihydrofolate reductase-like domain-containing protein [Vararia minispora EC-137]|uniref:Dihydrofolate reductase-like domain-containing protein n=1 Tax=Vararia minispora EC-137 TaxID=1314806 RepID=A0ACB8QL00_9AGAM|nr:dihydrofolate reductase-like domain-containing protein [Vararia minispora EC-137]